MNAQNAKDYFPLVQALVDGKTIQYQDELGDWLDCPEIMFDKDTPYRIKPQAREWWMVMNGANQVLGVWDWEMHTEAKRQGDTLMSSNNCKVVHVREVLD